MYNKPAKADIFDLQWIASKDVLNLANRHVADDSTFWEGLDRNLVNVNHRQYSMDRGGPGVIHGGSGTATLPPVCKVIGCDSILTVEDAPYIMCRQCYLEGRKL